VSDDKRLIEDYLPIEAISKEASREKNVRKGHISTLHLWWARRPLVACRAAVYGALVSASRFRPKNGPEEKRDSLARANAARFVEALCKYPADPQVIAQAQQHILEAHAERLTEETGKKVTIKDIEEGRSPRPKVLDMFAGGGAIPLEALRLGCEASALDLNPVAHIIELCTLVYPQKYGEPDKRAKGSAKDGTWAGLAAEVRYWGNWVLEKVRAEIGDLYPPIPDPKMPKARQLLGQPQLEMAGEGFDRKGQQRLGVEVPAGYLTPVAYLWTRTVRCKNPSCRGSVALVKQTWLCKKKDRYVALKMIAPKGKALVRFEVVEATSEEGLHFDPAAFSKGGNATCPFCGTVADSDYVKGEGCAGRIGQQMMAVASNRKGKQGKVYISADDLTSFVPSGADVHQRIEALCARTGLTVPNEPIINDAKNANFCIHYGLTTFGDLYSPRQMLSLLTFVAGVREAETQIKSRSYDEDRAKAVVTLLAAIVDRLADFSSSICVFNYTGGRGVKNTFGRQAIPIAWDFAETNPFNPEGASWISGIEALPAGLGDARMQNPGVVLRGSSLSIPWSDRTFDAVITDPPYYDNVPYANISDFFYVWLKRTVAHLYPEHFATAGTPKKSEAVADATRHGGDREKAKQAYEQMMARSFAEAHRVLKPNGQMTVVYAHKTTLGWATLVDALRQAGFVVTEAWPMDTEKRGRLRAQESAALASSIFLVARKSERTGTGTYEDKVRPELERIVRERVETLWDMGISGADLVISAVGAGLRAFTRFARVEYANGEEVPAQRFLTEVETVVLETILARLSKEVGGKQGLASVDPATRFYILWRYTYRSGNLDAGEAIIFANGTHVELDGLGGLSSGARPLLEKTTGSYSLLDYTERGDDKRLGMPSENGQTAPLIDTLQRTLWLMEKRPGHLDDFLREARPNLEQMRLVAQALAGSALKGKSDEDKALMSTTQSEQASLSKLLANWRALVEQPAGPLFQS
jgi:putative DNA methylase